MKKETYDMLAELVNLLDSLPEERFDYKHWAGFNWRGNPDLSCGTAACAAGWATTLPSFRARGLVLYRSEWDAPTIGLQENGQIVESRSLTALSQVLQLDEHDVRFLFIPRTDSLRYATSSPDDAATAQTVAQHIRAFLRAHVVDEETTNWNGFLADFDLTGRYRFAYTGQRSLYLDEF